jgi:hypothetical protein
MTDRTEIRSGIPTFYTAAQAPGIRLSVSGGEFVDRPDTSGFEACVFSALVTLSVGLGRMVSGVFPHSAKCVFLTAELVETGIVPSWGPKIRIGLRGVCQAERLGSPRAFRAGSAVLATTRIPKTVLEELAFVASCHRAFGRARSEGWKTVRAPTTSPREGVKGEPGSRNVPARASSTAGPRRFGPMLDGAEEQHDGCRAIR